MIPDARYDINQAYVNAVMEMLRPVFLAHGSVVPVLEEGVASL